MPCNQTLLGFDVESQQLACIRYRVNPINYYLSCDIEDDPEQVVQCTAFTNSNCTSAVTESGYFAYGTDFRPYSLSTPNPGLYPRDFCQTSTYVKRCCNNDDIIYKVNSLSPIIGYPAPVGIILDLEVTDENSNVFRECFEVVSNVNVTVPVLSANQFFNEYEQCEECQSVNPNCYLIEGVRTFADCKTNELISLTVSESNTIKVGDVVFLSGNCYSASLIEPFSNSLGIAGPVLAGGCNNSLCKPTPPVIIESEYVSGCCDGRVYKLISGDKHPVGFTLSVKPDNFCFTVIKKPSSNVTIYNLNDLIGGVFYTNGCLSNECQPCPPIGTPISVGSTASPCEVIRISDMVIKCRVINPNPPALGVLSVDVSGGSQPYIYTWTTPEGNVIKNKKTLVDQPEGVYQIEVVDKYGDYTKKEFCELVEVLNCEFRATLKQRKDLSCFNSTDLKGYVFKID